jgi:hypothetical protein
MSDWVFTDSDTAHKFIIPAGTVLEPDQYLVLIEDDSAFTTRFPGVTNYIGETGFGLSGSGEFIKLVDGEGQIIDSLTYDDQVPWPVEADGSGATLELSDPSSDNAIAENWKASTAHGSPGQLNTVITSIDKTKNEKIPEKFFLSQNYPNPFNPVTTIEYSVPALGNLYSTPVQLKVFNILGQEVATLVNESKAPGNYKVTFNGSELSSGIYLYRIKAGNFSETKKLVILK